MRPQLLLLALLAGAAPMLAAAQDFYCMTGVPCGTGCTMGNGLCIQGRCFDATGSVEWECMAPMMAGGMTPLRLQGYGGNSGGAAATGAAAATADTPQPTTTTQPTQQRPQEPAVASTWQAAAADSSSSSDDSEEDSDDVSGSAYDAQLFAPVWAPMPQWSLSGGASAFPSFRSWFPSTGMPWWSGHATAPIMMMPPMPPMAGGFFGPGGIGAFNTGCGESGPCASGEFCDASGVCRPDDCVSQFKHGCSADTGKLEKVACPHFSGFKECFVSSTGGFRCFKGPSGSSLACASQRSNASGSIFTMSSGFETPRQQTAASAADREEVAAGSSSSTTTTTTTAPAAAKAAPETPPAEASADEPEAAAASSSGVEPVPAAVRDSSVRPSAFRKVSTEAGPAQPAKPVMLADAASQQGPYAPPMFAPDGSLLMMAAGGPEAGPAPISTMNVAQDGSGMAAGSAAGDYKSVVTRTGNGVSESSSTSFSNGGPAFASAVAGAAPPQQQQQQQQPLVPRGGTAASSRDGFTGAALSSGRAGPAAAAGPAKLEPASSATSRRSSVGAVTAVALAVALLMLLL